MTYFPDGMIPPPVSLDTAAFWDAAKEHRFVLQRCEDCERFQHPPGPVCHRCRASNLIWSDVEGRGTVYTYTWVHKAFVPALQELLPYAVAVIELSSAERTRFVSNIVDVTPDTLTVGLPVELVWDDYAELSVPRFRPS
ncbi:MAG: Zn-ribbon domain-containing OB-fold protein [Actinomycetota bacterium]